MSCKDKLKQAHRVLETLSKGVFADVNLAVLPMGQQAFQQYASELLAADPTQHKQTLANIIQSYRDSKDAAQKAVLGEMIKAYIQLHHDQPEIILPIFYGAFGMSRLSLFSLDISAPPLRDMDLEICAELLRCNVPPTTLDPMPKFHALSKLGSYLESHASDLQSTNAGDLALAGSIVDLLQQPPLKDEDDLMDELSLADKSPAEWVNQAAQLIVDHRQTQAQAPTEDPLFYSSPSRKALNAIAERCAYRNQQTGAFVPSVPQGVLAGGNALPTDPENESAAWKAGKPLSSPALIVSQMKAALLKHAKLIEKQPAKPRWTAKLGFGQYGESLPHPKDAFTPEFLQGARERGAEPIDVALETLTVLGMEQGRRKRQRYIGDMADSALLHMDEWKTPADRKVAKQLILAAVERGIKPQNDNPYTPPIEDWPNDPRRQCDMSREAVQAVEKAIKSVYRVREGKNIQGWKWDGLDVNPDQWRNQSGWNLRDMFAPKQLEYNLEDREWVGSYLEVITRATYTLAEEQGLRENFPADLLKQADRVIYRKYRNH